MIGTPGTSEHIMRVLKDYARFEATVREHLPDLARDHSADVAKRLADVDANLVKADRETINAAIEKLRADDPEFLAPAPLGQYLVRLMIATNPGQDLGSLRAAVDRMHVETKRRCAYAATKALIAEGKHVPEPRDTDGNIATAPPGTAPSTPHRRFRDGTIGGVQPDAAPVDVDDRDADRPNHLKLQPMKRHLNRA